MFLLDTVLLMLMILLLCKKQQPLKQKLLNGQQMEQGKVLEFSQIVYRLTGKVASYLKENPSKADQTMALLQHVYQLDSELDV